MIFIILKGILIGLLSSAPMGPVGMLCIQRTLNEGRSHGLVTGFGAAVGDLLYAFIAILGALGLGFILDYIERHHAPFQIGGSIILIVFGCIVYRQNPSKSLTKLEKKELPFGKVFVSSLALTLSNIGMLFLYMALFARFNMIDPVNFWQSMSVVPAVGVGALLWWFFITYVVDRLRHKFNLRGLKLFNKIVGLILVIIGIVGVITGTYIKIYGDFDIL